MIQKYKSIIVFLLLIFQVVSVEANDDFQLWQAMVLKFKPVANTDLSFFMTGRLKNDVRDESYYQLSPQLKKELNDIWAIGLNYSYVQNKVFSPSAGRGEFRLQHRAEIDIFCRAVQREYIKLNLRQRTEFRWIENQGWDHTRIRLLGTVDIPLKNKGRLTSVYMSVEPFYDLHRHELTEHRVIPLGFNFKLNDRASLKVYYMQQLIPTFGNWSVNHALGMTWGVQF